MGYNKYPRNEEQVRIIATLSTMIILSTLIFGLRLLARWLSVARFWLDDYMAFLALIFSYGPVTFVLLAIRYGLGEHAGVVGVQGVSHVVQLAFLTQIFWQVTMPTVKTSLLLLYYRLFPGQNLRRATFMVGALMWSFFIASTIVQLNICVPVRFFWNKDISGGRCPLDVNKFYLSGSIFNMITDIMVLSLPLPTVWNLQISVKKKIGLSFVFLLGSLVCVASSMRIVLTNRLAPPDITGLAVNVAIWTCVETSLGVICACIPCLTPLVLRAMRLIRKRKISGSPTFNRARIEYNAESCTRDYGFRRMDDLSELSATFELTLNGESYAECRASDVVQNVNLNPFGINVMSEVKQTSEPSMKVS